MNHNTFEFHEAANIFPLDEEHLDGLADDIRKHGQQVAIELLDGRILDGRRRYLACGKAGIAPRFIEVDVADPVQYVLSLNLHRRHLTPSQASMVGARARDYYDKQAKERQAATRKKGNSPVPVNLPERDKGDARDQAARAVGVSGKSIDFATKVIKGAVPEVIKAVDEGRMAVSTAAALASEPEEVQKREAEFIADGRRRNRKYTSTANGAAEESIPQKTKEQEDGKAIEVKGVGVFKAHEAINRLKEIPKDDGLRKRGFQIVTDWIRHNQ